jgi:hypothetical protein
MVMTLLIVNIMLVIVPLWLIIAFHTKGEDTSPLLSPPTVYIVKARKTRDDHSDFRMDRVKKMREEGKTNQEISEVTGLSISYLKKIKG